MKVVCPLRPVSPGPPGETDGFHYFFGYYDKCPWSADAATLLAHRVRFIERPPEPDDTADLGLITLHPDRPGDFLPLGQTRAWNWQQGAQLQWLPTASNPNSESILYNDRRGGRAIAVITSPDGRDERIIEHPVYTVAPHGRTALTLDYGRLTHLRPEYGWTGEPDPSHDDPAPDTSGVYRLDLATGRREMLISIAALAHHRPSPLAMLPGQILAHQHVNHLMFNPSGDRFCFLHRFTRADGILHSRLFTLGVDGRDLRLLMEGMVSHYHWRDDSTILAWAGRRALLDAGASGASAGGPAAVMAATLSTARRALKPVYYALGKPRFLMNRILRDSYLLITDTENAPTTPFAKGELTCDGHCTFSPDRRWVLTDGYPDLQHRQPLFLWDSATSRAFEIGRYPTPKRLDGPVRVDLHPRFDRAGRAACIDSAMDGSRRMYVLDLTPVVSPPA